MLQYCTTGNSTKTAWSMDCGSDSLDSIMEDQKSCKTDTDTHAALVLDMDDSLQ